MDSYSQIKRIKKIGDTYMDLVKFASEMDRNDIPVENDWKKIDQAIRMSIDKRHDEDLPYGYNNLVTILSELSELGVAITKHMLGKKSINLLEEMADVTCALRYLSIITGIDEKDISKAVNIKMQREVERIAETDQEKKLLIYPIE